MRPDLRTLGALLFAAVLVFLGAPAPAVAAEPEPTSSVAVDTAVLRWGMSNEANNAAFARGTYNFFSAGKIADPGRGNVALTQSGWSQQVGTVAIQKWNGNAYDSATWAGLGTDKNGVAITGPGSGRYSDHQFVFSGGTGSVDPVAGTAHIGWTGDVTVLFYSGYTFFYLSDPVLEVAGGHGAITATLSGFGSTRDNPDQWVAITPKTVTVANLPNLDLADVAGFTATPAYDGVTTTLDGASTTGSFPQSYVAFMNDLGTAPFWRNSGSSTDVAKKALPLTVSYDASSPVDIPEPEKHTPAPVINNDAPDPPKTVVQTTTRIPATPTPVVPVPAAAPAFEPLTTSAVMELVASRTQPPASARESSWAWWLGGAFLLLAALSLAGSTLIPPSTPSKGQP